MDGTTRHATPAICPGSGEFVNETTVDGSSMTWCLTCGRRRSAQQIDGYPQWFGIQTHPQLVVTT